VSDDRVIYYSGIGTWCMEIEYTCTENNTNKFDTVRVYTTYESGLFKLPEINEKEFGYSNKCTVNRLYPFEHEDAVHVDNGFDYFELDKPQTFNKSEIVKKNLLASQRKENKEQKRVSPHYKKLYAQICHDVIYILEKNPKLCVNEDNKIVATRLTKAVINKWKEDNDTQDKNPLDDRTIYDHIRKFLRENPQLLQKLQFKF
jgi:hypothetical protein